MGDPIDKKEAGRMTSFPKTKDTPLVRTDFSDEAAWTALCAAVEQSVGDFRAYVTPIDDRAFDRATVQQVIEAASGCGHPLTLVADERAVRDSEHPILVIDLAGEPGRTFRVVPSEAWGVENNLSLANMDWEDFADAVDEDGVFRGLPRD
jgi:hypothetical protein